MHIIGLQSGIVLQRDAANHCDSYFTLQGIGDTIMPMVSGFAEFIMRVGAALLLPLFMGQDGIFYAEILAWTGAVVVLVSAYLYHVKKWTR